MASTERHKARGDEVVKVATSAAPDALFSIVETWSHMQDHYTLAWRTDTCTKKKINAETKAFLVF